MRRPRLGRESAAADVRHAADVLTHRIEHGKAAPARDPGSAPKRVVMTYAEKLARLAYYGVWLLIAAGLAWLAWHALSPAPIDPRTGTAGLKVETDVGTGCQYVVTPWGGIFARLDADGKPMCEGPGK